MNNTDNSEKIQTFYRKKTGTEATEEELDETMRQYLQKRQQIVDLEAKMHFSYDIGETLTEDDKLVDQILNKMRLKYKNDQFDIIIHDFFKNQKTLKDSELYSILDIMPKGGLHHLHTTAAPSVDFYIQLTYNEAVYFNEREKLFKVAPKGLDEDGYIKCTELRRFSASAEEFDQKLKNYIRMTPEECASKESHEIWTHFQHKFTLINDLGKYKDFFKLILHEVLNKCAAQNIFIVELRHIFGMLFDDDRNPIQLEEEIKLIDDQVKHIQQDIPYFRLKLIITGLKIVGKPHVRKMISNIVEGGQYSELIAGFDLVNEEDFSPPILEFLTDILEGKNQEKKNKMPCFFHCGETHDRTNQNVYDALLLNSKRIGHGFQLFLHPHLQQQVKQKDICIEVCPISNLLLGYTTDLRIHPVRFMLHRGLQASISSDDPGFFGYEGVTLDYVYAFLAWDLDIKDLKKLSLNGIVYSSLDKEHKDYLISDVFEKKWREFVQIVLEKFQA